MFQLTIINSLDSTFEVADGEHCARFFSRSVKVKAMTGRKSLIALQRSDLERGCTVLLRGGERRELAKVKRVLSRVLLLKSNAR